jgi:hypothetical protein
MSTAMVIKMSKVNDFFENWPKSFILKLAISRVFCATKTVCSIMKSAISEQNFEQMIIYIAVFKQNL